MTNRKPRTRQLQSPVAAPPPPTNTLKSWVKRTMEVPWSKAEELCRRGAVHVNGLSISDPGYRFSESDVMEIKKDTAESRGVLSRDAIVYSDEAVVIVRKPPHVVTVPFEKGERDTLVDMLRARLKRDTQSRDPFLGVVHRIDKETTGLLVFARSMKAKRSLEAQFRVHSVHRRYLALVHGDVTSQTIRSYLVQDRGDGLRGSARMPTWSAAIDVPERESESGERVPFGAKLAVTHVEALRTNLVSTPEGQTSVTLVSCELETGRQHQIRIHLSELGHPLLGEAVYVRRFEGPRIPAPRVMLHARELGFQHPITGKEVLFIDDLPDDFVAVQTRLGLEH